MIYSTSFLFTSSSLAESHCHNISLVIVNTFFSSSVKSFSSNLLFTLPKYLKVQVKSFPMYILLLGYVILYIHFIRRQ